MTVFVTGGAGFIGSNLVERLVKEGQKVVVFDNLSTGNLENLREIKDKIKIEKSYSELNSKEPPEMIFHLGIPSSSPMYKENPHLVSEAIKDWTNILEYARKHNCKIVWASSSSIYNGNEVPFKEDMKIFVTDYYTECRYSMERLAELYYRLYGIKSIGLRLFSVYGPKEDYKGKYANCLTQFLWKMLKGESPVIYGDGSQTRDFIYVSDVVEAFLLASKSKHNCEIFNVGTGVPHSFDDIINMLNDVLGTNIKATYVDNPIKNYVQCTLADTRKAESLLRFKSKVSLKEGIQILLKIYRK